MLQLLLAPSRCDGQGYFSLISALADIDLGRAQLHRGCPVRRRGLLPSYGRSRVRLPPGHTRSVAQWQSAYVPSPTPISGSLWPWLPSSRRRGRHGQVQHRHARPPRPAGPRRGDAVRRHLRGRRRATPATPSRAVPAGRGQHGRRGHLLRAAGARDDRYATLVRAVAVEDPEWTARFLRWLRGDANMRSASLVGAAECGQGDGSTPALPGGAGRSSTSVLQRADEPGELLAYWTAAYGRACRSRSSAASPTRSARLYTERSLLKYDTASHGLPVRRRPRPDPPGDRGDEPGRATCSGTRSTAGTTAANPIAGRRCRCSPAQRCCLRRSAGRRTRAALLGRRRARARPA